MKLAQKITVGYFRTRLRILSWWSNRKAAESALDLFCTPLRKSRRKTPAVFQNAEDLRIDLPDGYLSGHRWKGAGGKKILIVHGFESSPKNFDCYISSLIKKSCEVVIFDAPAHGRSSGKTIDLPAYLRALVRINELYGPFDGFIAHSFGGLAVAHLLEAVPHSASTRAALIAPATETVTSINLFFRFLHLNQKVRKQFDKLIFERSGFHPEYFSVKRAMQKIRAKILWVHDEDDDLTPLADALLVKKEEHANVEFRITRGLGHRRIYRDQAIVREIIEFI